MFRKLALGVLSVLLAAIAAFAMYVASRQHLKFDPPYPEITASADSAVIARGAYVVRDVANCASCHGDPKQADAASAGAEVPLSGGYVFRIPPGNFHVRNITSDSATGIGAVSDKAIARALRAGVGHDGRALLPFMEMQGLSDEDLLAVVSYLRTQPAVKNAVPPHEFNLLGMVVRATALSRPVGPRETPPKQSPRGATVENGRYLVESVALCGACHTERSKQTGEFTGPMLGGAVGFEPAADGVHMWSPPNITSDPETGRLGHQSEDEFVTRFRAGRLIPGSPMPWQGYARLTDDDLRAIYRYLMTVPPVKRDVGPPLVEKKKG